MTIRRQFDLVRSWLWLAIMCAALAGGAAFLISRQLPAVYTSEARLLVGTSLSNARPEFSEIQVARALTQVYGDLARTRPILDRVVADLDLGISAADLAKDVSTSVEAETTLVVIVHANSPVRAAAIANEIGSALITSVPTVQGPAAAAQLAIQQELADTQALIDATSATVRDLSAIPARTAAQDGRLNGALAQLDSLRATRSALIASLASVPANTLTVIDPATPPTDPVSPRTFLNSALGIAIGVVIAVVIAFIAENLRSGTRTKPGVSNEA